MPIRLFRYLFVFCFAATPAFGQAPANTEALRVRDLFEIESHGPTELSSFSIAIDVASLRSTDEGWTAMRVSRLLEQVTGKQADRNRAIAEVDQTCVVPVRVRVQLPPDGAVRGQTIDCRVESLDETSLDGMILVMTQLQSNDQDDDTVYAHAAGAISADGSISAGAVMEADCLSRIVTTIPGEGSYITLRLKRSSGITSDVDLAVQASRKINASWDPYFAKNKHLERSASSPIGVNRLRVWVPESYLRQEIEFAADVAEAIVPVNPAVVAESKPVARSIVK